MDVLTIVGARPQFIKAAVVSRAFQQCEGVTESIVHTGQHYDEKMSQLFFDELNIPRPKYNLAAGSGSHGKQTGLILEGIEQILLDDKPDVMLVYGDTNSTLAGALAAAKLHIPIAHVEAGLRSFNRRMPEEINRVVTDHLSELLFCPTDAAVENLAKEGITHGVHQVGDVMLDCTQTFGAVADSVVQPLKDYELTEGQYVLMTCHRAENTDDETRMRGILQAVAEIAKTQPVLFPMHPRTKGTLAKLGYEIPPGLKIVEPVSYLEMLVLAKHASLILTDSGGLQKESFFLGTPCVTMRDDTEWIETVSLGANILAGADPEKILAGVATQLTKGPLPDAGEHYGHGKASERIVKLVAEAVSG